MHADAKKENVYMHRLFPVGRDQRLHDNPRLIEACRKASTLLPVYDLDPSISYGPHRIAFLLDSLRALQVQLRSRGSDLLLRIQVPSSADMQWYNAAPTMYDKADLPFDLQAMPEVFTSFRRLLEKHAVPVQVPVDAPIVLPPLPDGIVCPDIPSPEQLGYDVMACDARSAFPYVQARWQAGEETAQKHLREYLASHTVDTYKATRNGLIGTSFSSKLSPWLALGNISARTITTALWDYEEDHGANDGTYWLWFELVWRDFFAFRAQQRGRTPSAALERANEHLQFRAWTSGTTGAAFVDAAMKELLLSGWLSNRMRQIAASYLINELRLPWQWGEAWFAMQLVDYDPASNEGNWRYIAGQGADPRGGRHFSITHQQDMYDPNGEYIAYWK
jgi:deoxyribodipyrimidine photo-lyase